MNIKEKIQQDFISFMKSKNDIGKLTLGMLKSKITEAEKANNTVLTNEELLNVIIKSIKQREESAKQYQMANRNDLFVRENQEIDILKVYLPQQMSQDVLYTELKQIMLGLKNATPTLNDNVLSGKTIGLFNSKFKGQADINVVKDVINKILIELKPE